MSTREKRNCFVNTATGGRWGKPKEEGKLFLTTSFPNSSRALKPLFWIQILSLICKSPGSALGS